MLLCLHASLRDDAVSSLVIIYWLLALGRINGVLTSVYTALRQPFLGFNMTFRHSCTCTIALRDFD